MPARPVVEARRLGLRSDDGWAYRDFDLTVRPGELVALTGAEGGGRTQLLLTLAVRVMPSEGTLRICGHPVPESAEAARARLALARLPDVVASDPSVSVRDCVETRLTLSSLPADLFQVAAELVGFAADRDVPVSSLPPLQLRLFGLALAVTAPVELVLIDAADTDLDSLERSTMWSALRAVVRTGIAVIAGTPHSTPRADKVALVQ